MLFSKWTLEAKVLQHNYARLRDTIQAPEDVANHLFSREKIDSHTRDKVQLHTLTTSEKCEELLKAVENRISADPSVFYEFIVVLSEEPTMEKLAYQLVCDLRKCALSAAGWIQLYNLWRRFGVLGSWILMSFVVVVVLQIILDLWRYNLSMETYITIVGALVCINVYMHWSTKGLPTNQNTSPPSEHTVCVADREECQHCSSSQYGATVTKDLPVLRFTGPIKQIHEIDHRFICLLLSNKAQEVNQMAEAIISISVDVKVIAECYQASSKATFQGQDNYAEPLYKSALARAAQSECENCFLLRAMVLKHYAILLCSKGEYERAQEYIIGAKQNLFNAAPSFQKASVLLQDIQLQLDSKLKGTPLDLKTVEKTYDLAVYCMDFSEEHEKPGVCICLTRKAAFHLRSYEIDENLPPEECRPSAEDMYKATCLDRVPLDVLPSKSNYYVAEYCLALSDLYLWKTDYPKATKFAMEAKQHFVQGKITNQRSCIPDKRLKLLMRLQDQKTEDTKLHRILHSYH